MERASGVSGGEHDFRRKMVSNQQNEDSRVERNYTNLFPSGGLTYQLNQKNQFALLQQTNSTSKLPVLKSVRICNR